MTAPARSPVAAEIAALDIAVCCWAGSTDHRQQRRCCCPIAIRWRSSESWEDIRYLASEVRLLDEGRRATRALISNWRDGALPRVALAEPRVDAGGRNRETVCFTYRQDLRTYRAKLSRAMHACGDYERRTATRQHQVCRGESASRTFVSAFSPVARSVTARRAL